MDSEASVCNVALARVGHSHFIDGNLADDDSAAGQACAQLYPHTRDLILQAFQWSFCTKRAALAKVAGATKREGWKHIYALPADCLAPRVVWQDKGANRNPASDEREPYALEWDETAGAKRRVLLTDAPTAFLAYTRTIDADNVVYLSPLCQDAIAWRLAVDLALVLPVKERLAVDAERKAQLSLQVAIAADLGERQKDVAPDSEFVRTR